MTKEKQNKLDKLLSDFLEIFLVEKLKTKPFLIPQNADDYLGFKSKMQDEENMLINSIL